MLALNIAGGHGMLLNRPHRFPGDSIKCKDETLLGFLSYRVDRLAVYMDRNQCWRGGQVVIPEAVVNDLEMPLLFAGGGIQTHECFPVKVIADTVAAVEVVARRAYVKINKAPNRIQRLRGPHIGLI